MKKNYFLDTRKSEPISDKTIIKKDTRLMFIRAIGNQSSETISKDDSNIVLGITLKAKDNIPTKIILFEIIETVEEDEDTNFTEKRAIGRTANLFFLKVTAIFYKDKLMMVPVYTSDILDGQENSNLVLIECWDEK